MTIELDTTLSQAEVLFLSFAQLVASVDRRRAEGSVAPETNGLRRRANTSGSPESASASILELSQDLRDLLKAGR